DACLLQGSLDARLQRAVYLGAAVGGDLHGGVLRERVRCRVQQAERKRQRHDQVSQPGIFEHRTTPHAPERRALRSTEKDQADFSVPLGRTLAMAPFCTRSCTPLATSTVMKASLRATTVPAMPPLVMTSSPLASLSSMALCSFCRFICGRIIRKYMIAIRKIGRASCREGGEHGGEA